MHIIVYQALTLPLPPVAQSEEEPTVKDEKPAAGPSEPGVPVSVSTLDGAGAGFPEQQVPMPPPPRVPSSAHMRRPASAQSTHAGGEIHVVSESRVG